MPLAIATYNLKDFFAIPRVPADLFPRRVAYLSSRILASGATLVALQEVGESDALDALLAALGASWTAIAGTPDERGIRNAIITTETVRHSELLSTKELPFPVFIAGDAPPFGPRLGLRRAIVRVDIEHATYGDISVLCMHLKSNLPRALKLADGTEQPRLTGKEHAEAMIRSAVIRSAEALFVRGVVDELRSSTPPRQVCVAGDMNDDARSLPLRILKGEGADALLSAIDHVKEHKRFTALHRGKPAQLDHLLFSPELHARVTNADIWNEDLYDHGPPVQGAPMYVESDHALHVATFQG